MIVISTTYRNYEDGSTTNSYTHRQYQNLHKSKRERLTDHYKKDSIVTNLHKIQGASRILIYGDEKRKKREIKQFEIH